MCKCDPNIRAPFCAACEPPKEKIEYLYGKSRYSGLCRYRITRQTDKTYWIYFNKTYEERISKKRMKTGSGFDVTYYREETPRLKEEYEELALFKAYLRKLEQLKKVDDVHIWNTIIEIPIEGEK